MIKNSGERLVAFLRSIKAVSLYLGIFSIILSAGAVFLYLTTSIFLFKVLAVMFGAYGCVRIWCAISGKLPRYINILTCYVGITLWLTIGISSLGFNGVTAAIVWAILAIPIVCDFLFTTVSSIGQNKSEDSNA